MHRLLVTCVRSALLLIALVLAATIVSAEPARGAPASAWEPTGLSAPVNRLFAPASGALLAAGDAGLLRSDDGGTSWRDVPLPPGADLSVAVGQSYRPAHVGPGRLAVDPTNHDVIYASTVGLNKTTDGGATWEDIGGKDLGAEIHDLALGIDGANLYAATTAGVLRLAMP
jgi:photosystem II stability/assembly factor-like uncharacterized protein